MKRTATYGNRGRTRAHHVPVSRGSTPRVAGMRGSSVGKDATPDPAAPQGRDYPNRTNPFGLTGQGEKSRSLNLPAASVVVSGTYPVLTIVVNRT